MGRIDEGGICPGCGREGRFYSDRQVLHSLHLEVRSDRCRSCGLVSVRGRRIYDPNDLELRRVPFLEWCKHLLTEFTEEVQRIEAREEARR